jgi:hypothetical protein
MANHVDYDTDKRIIYVTTAPTDGVITLDVQIDIYSDIKEDWKTNSTLNKLDFPLRPTGGDTIVGTKIKSPFYFIKDPWRFRPYEASHTLYLENAYLVVDGGGEPWLTTEGAYTVNIRDSVPSDAFTLASDTKNVADAVWDEALVSHTLSGSAGDALGNVSAGSDPSQIADAVWDEPRGDHVTADTFGAKNQNLVPSENIDDYKATDVSISVSGIADAVWDETATEHTSVGTFGAKNQNLVPSENIDDYKGGTVDVNYSGISDAVWDAETANYTTQGTYGAELATKADLAASTSTSQTPAYSGIAVQGSTVTGDYTSTFTRDNAYWEIAEDASNGITLEFTFYIPEDNKPGTFNIFGRYTGQPAITHHQELWFYNYESTSWELVNDDFIPGGSTSDTSYNHEYYERHIDRTNNNEVKVRTIHNVTAYNAAHRFYIDYIDLSSVEVTTAADIANAVWANADGILIASGVEIIRQIEMGKWKIENNQMVFYEEDNVTEIMRFNLFDEAGGPANTDIFDRQRV